MHNGMNMSADAEGSFTLVLSKPIGAGTMKGYAISQNLFVANVDFSCERCPNMAVPGIGATDPAHEKRGVWFTINRCIEGRCETAIPESGVAVVAEGDVCVSCSTALPESFSYPLARYRGIELFVCCDIDDEAAYALLGEAHSKTKQLAALAGSASVFTQDDELLEIIDRMAECAQGGLKAETKLCALNLSWLCRSAISQPRSPRHCSQGANSISRNLREMKSRPTSLPHTTLAPWRKRVAFQPRRSTATFRAFTEQRFPLTCANGESTRRRKRFYRERAFPQRRSRQGTATRANSPPHSNAKWAPRPRHSKDALDKGTATNARMSALGASLPIWMPCRS